MRKLSKDMTIPEVERHLKTLNSADEVAAYMTGERRKLAIGMQAGRLTEIQHPGAAIKVSLAAPDPATTRPATKAEAKAIRETAAANRPHTKPLPGINPPSTREKIAERNMQVAAELVDQLTKAVHEGIDDIMAWRDKADAIAGQEDKFTYAVPAKIRIVREAGDFAVKVRLTRNLKDMIEREGTVHIANPEGDLADMAAANS